MKMPPIARPAATSGAATKDWSLSSNHGYRAAISSGDAQTMISPLRIASVSGVWTSSGICSHALIVSAGYPSLATSSRPPRPPRSA